MIHDLNSTCWSIICSSSWTSAWLLIAVESYVYYRSLFIQPPVLGCLGLKMQCLTQRPCIYIYIYIFAFVWIEYMWTWQKSDAQRKMHSYVYSHKHVLIVLGSSGALKPTHRSQAKNPQLTSVAQSCPTLCDPMDCSTPGFPVHHQLLEFTQTHVHWVGDAIQASHPLSSPSPYASQLRNPGYTVKNSLLYSQ